MSQLAQRIPPSIKQELVPELTSGDRLTSLEFERRYRLSKGKSRAELIEGVVYVSPPVSLFDHGAPHVDLITLVGIYRAMTPGVIAGDNTTVRLDSENRTQPDVLLVRARTGASTVDADQFISGTPEWIAEIAASSASYDLHDKLRAYQRNGGAEYVVWRTLDGAIDYFVLRDGEYLPASSDTDGIVRSAVFPGLWLNTKALLAGDLAAAIATMQAGIASPEHTAFIATLTAAP